MADEFVVVNDGSSAEETERLHEIAAELGFRVLDKENGGQGSARNFGVSQTTSEYICFLDQDDFFLPTHIELLLKAVPRADTLFGWVYGDLMEADEHGNIIRTAVVKEHSRHPKTNIFDLIRHDMFVLPSASLISRAAYNAVDGFDTQFTGYEDDDIFLRMFRKGFTNKFVDRPVTVWCIHTGSTSYSIRMSRSRYKYFLKLAENFPDDPDRGRYFMRDLIAPRFRNSILGDALLSSGSGTASQNSRLAPYREELLEILQGFHDVIKKNQYYSRKDRLTLWLQIELIKLNSPVLLKAAMRTRTAMRSTRVARG